MPNQVHAHPPQVDAQTFTSLYQTHRGALLARIRRLVGNRELAEDLTESTFHTAWEKRAQFRGASSLRTWLYAIGLNAVRESWRSARRVREEPLEHLDEARHGQRDQVLAKLEREELREQLGRALRVVAASDRKVLTDRHINGSSIHEIARREHVPTGTVGSRLFTAAGRLRQAWEAAGAPDPKAMSDDRARQIAEESLKRLTEELQAGRSDALKTYLAAMGRFHRYSWTNTLLIQSQRPDATRVAGYHTWRDLGRSVRRGEKGIVIYAPIVARPKQEPALMPGEKAKGRDPVGFRAAYVFDVSQTEGKPLPAPSATTGNPKEYLDKLKTIVAQRGIELDYDPAIAPADGQSSGGRIQIRPGLAPAEEFAVLAHELAHEMLHRGIDRATLSKTVRETQAEAVAFVVSRGIGLETNSAARDYIALYNGDAKTLAESLAAVQQTSSAILRDLLPTERTVSERMANEPGSRETTSPEPPAETPLGDRPPESPAPDLSITLDR